MIDFAAGLVVFTAWLGDAGLQSLQCLNCNTLAGRTETAILSGLFPCGLTKVTG